mmetsp:Transcript_59616/g.122239  ORF Transcript_59616/g.122239 Transcript_59616/m.122239 type:complete len:349 (-) Transcript_59616:188-1234(-)
MAPKKKAKSENGSKVTDSGEDGGDVDVKVESTEASGGDGALPVASQQCCGGGGPEAPKLELAGLENFEYTPGKAIEGFEVGTLVRCEIDAKHLTQENVGVKERRLWGGDPYTDNSDLVAIAMHSSVYTPTADVPKFAALVMVVRVMGVQAVYPASSRNTLKSRSLTGVEHDGLSICLEGSAMCKTAEDRTKLTHVILRPSRLDRFSIKGHNAFADARVVFNLSNEPALKYSLSMIADRSPDAKNWTSVRLKAQTLYLETRGGRRFELSLSSLNPDAVTYKLAELPRPHTVTKAAIIEKGVPLPEGDKVEVHGNVKWTEFQWGVSSVRVRGAQYRLASLFWLPCSPTTG